MRIEERWPNQTVRRGLGKSQHGGASWGWLRGTGWWRAGLWLCAARGGGSAGPVLHSQGSHERWGYRADALWGICCYDPVLVPALSRCCTIFLGHWGKELLLKGEWDGFVWGQAVWGLGIGVV
jgi:hypothetical protein